MANWYSDRIGTDGSADSTVGSPFPTTPAGRADGRMRISHSSITVTNTGAADVLWMARFKSSDRVLAVYYNTDGGFNASSSCELGFYTGNSTYDGAVLDVDLYGAAIDLTSALDVLTETFSVGALGGEDRMKTVWECLAVGDQSYTVDPAILVDLCMTLDSDDDATSSTLTLSVLYTSVG